MSFNTDITEAGYEDGSQSTQGYNRDHFVYAKAFQNLEIVGNYFKGMNKNQDGGVKCRNGEGLLVYKNILEDSLLLLYVQDDATGAILKNVDIRENIFINASIFGLTRKEIKQRMESIIDFSELGEYMDSPVRTYSTGMYMRLAFSVAIHVNAEVLLIDEILGVGDMYFQEKCFRKLQEIKRNGTTIVIVSHSLEQIEEICEKSIWIQEGEIAEIGLPKAVHTSYRNYMNQKNIRENS